MKNTQILCLVLALVMLLGVFAGCGQGNANTTTAPKATDAPATDAPATDAPVVDEKEYAYGTVHGITWQWGGQADKSDTTAVLNEEGRNAKYFLDTGNTRECVPFSYDYRSVGALFEGGNMPTVFSVAATEPVKLIKNGWGRDISQQVETLGINLENFNQAVLETYYDQDGKLYGLPYTAYAISLFCNGQLFIDAGLVNDDGTPKLPTTWDEVMEYCKIITAKTGKGGFALTAANNEGGWNFSNLCWNFGGDLVTVNSDGTYTATVNSPEAVAAMEFYRQMALEGCFYGDPLVDTRSSVYNQLKAGNAAMCWGGVGSAADMSNRNTDGMDPNDLYVCTVPAGPTGIQKSLTGGAGFWFNSAATDDQVTAALEYLINVEGYWADEVTDYMKNNWIETWENNLELNKVNIPGFPVYMSTVENTKNEMMKDYQSNFDFDKQYAKHYEEVTQLGALQSEEEGDTQNVYREMTAVIQQIVTDPKNADVQELMDEAQIIVQQLLDDFVAEK